MTASNCEDDLGPGDEGGPGGGEIETQMVDTLSRVETIMANVQFLINKQSCESRALLQREQDRRKESMDMQVLQTTRKDVIGWPWQRQEMSYGQTCLLHAGHNKVTVRVAVCWWGLCGVGEDCALFVTVGECL